jgi:ribosome maturation factor RimP
MRFRDQRPRKERRTAAEIEEEAGTRAARGGRGSEPEANRRRGDRPERLEKPECERLEAAARAALEAAAFDVVRVRVYPERRVRAMVDGPAGAPVTVGDCERASRALADALAAAGADPGTFDVEVESPGADRPLTRPADFERFREKQVTLTLWEARDGRRNYTGALLGRSESGEVTVHVLDEEAPTTFPAKEVREVRLHPEAKLPPRERPDRL